MLAIFSILSILLCVSAPAHGDTEFRVVTYNIHHAEGTDGKLDLQRIAGVLLAERPDIVCLQEVDRGCARTKGIDMPAELAKLLDMNVAFGPNLDFDGGDYGNATFTRFPIVDTENFTLPLVEAGERRGCLRVVVEIGGQRVDVLNTHFDLPSDARKDQAARVLDLTRAIPTILAGDLNEPPDAPAVSVLLTRFRDTFRAQPDSGQPGEATADTARIDFILVTAPVDVLSSRFVVTPQAKAASDHLPYVARLSLGTPPETAQDKGVRDNRDERIEKALIPGEREWPR